MLAAAIVLAVVAGCAPAAEPQRSVAASAAGYGGVELTTPYSLPDVTLTDQDGKSFDVRAGSGKPVLVFFFGYTHCPDICLGVLTDLASASNRLPEEVRAKLQVVFVTVDPARDDPAALRTYLNRIDPGFLGLTGDAGDIERLAEAMGVGIEGTQRLPNGDYEVLHTAQVVGFDAQRRGVLVWTQGTPIGTYRSDFERLVRQQG